MCACRRNVLLSSVVLILAEFRPHAGGETGYGFDDLQQLLSDSQFAPDSVNCTQVLEASLVIRQRAFTRVRSLHEEYQQLVKVKPELEWVPKHLYQVVEAVSGAILRNAQICRQHKDCIPRVWREGLVLLAHHWVFLHKGLMALTWWQFQHNVFGNLVDHPANVSESEMAYVGSWMLQVDIALETDVEDGSAVLIDWRGVVDRGGEVLLRQLVQSDNAEYMEDNLGAHGTFDVLDILRRDTFDGWWTDYGVIGIFLQLVVADNRAPGATVLDIGAGGGHYSTFLNRTGLVTAFAVDAAGGEDELQRYTGSKVQFFDAQEPVVNSPYASRQFDYILCLEVAEHIKPDKTHIFVRNLDLLGKRGLVLSWAQEESCGLGWGHVNCRNTEDVIFLMEKSTSYRVDLDITAHLRAKSQISWIAKTVLYFSKPQEQHHTTGPVHNQRVAHPESIEPLSILANAARQQGASTAPSPQVHDMQQKEQPHVPGAGDHGLFSGSASILSSSELRTNGNLFDATSSHRRAGNEGSAPGSASRDDSFGASRVGSK
eukprot:GEMP01018622.1.p1 GENE.GEMP01018622.1~~GEMP01018622.1.p1  ORF type:complete len:543 (+),score=122.54 GEMP01018622.1:81-1709(+)